jgi:hypothetical protein
MKTWLIYYSERQKRLPIAQSEQQAVLDENRDKET